MKRFWRWIFNDCQCGCENEKGKISCEKMIKKYKKCGWINQKKALDNGEFDED